MTGPACKGKYIGPRRRIRKYGYAIIEHGGPGGFTQTGGVNANPPQLYIGGAVGGTDDFLGGAIAKAVRFSAGDGVAVTAGDGDRRKVTVITDVVRLMLVEDAEI